MDECKSSKCKLRDDLKNAASVQNTEAARFGPSAGANQPQTVARRIRQPHGVSTRRRTM